MKNIFKKGWLVSALLALSAGVAAEDIDLFVGVESTQSTDYPNVIILIDNSTNWSAANQQWPGGIKQGQAELNAIKTVINALAPSGTDAKVNVSLMMLNEASGQTPDGGYVRSSMKQMTDTNRTSFGTLLDSIYNDFNNPAETVSASTGYDRALFEAFKYFGGYTSVANAYSDTAGSPVSSTHFGPRRYSGSTNYSQRDASAFSDAAQTTYIPAAPTAETCKSKNYVILIGNGWPAPRESEAETLLQNVGGDTSQVYATSSSKVRYADEIARFMYQTDVSAAPGKQNVITYAIDVYNAQQDQDHTKLLKSTAQVGGGKYFAATNASEIEAALSKIFSEIQAVNSVFASVSLPVSVNTQGTYLNQVYVGMFRPDQNASPRWAGNLKQYKLGLVDNELELQDADSDSAINSSTGFVTECARSFWTPSALTSYWSSVTLSPGGGCLAVSNSANSDYPDGNVVEKGAQSYKLRSLGGISARNVKTCSTTACTALADFTSSTVTSITADEVNWARGSDNATTSEFSTDPRPTTTTIRPSVHGDIVHSRPVAINFGTDDDKEVVVFYGGNDGLLRAVNGNRDSGSSLAGVPPGGELWSFMAPEFYSQIQRLRNNTVAIDFPGLTLPETAADPLPKPYGFDGSITAHRHSSGAWVYATMRRGGNALYAFNVSDSALGTPSLKWRIGCSETDASWSCTDSDFNQMGQTWSAAKPFLASGYGSGTSPLLIMGGGYDTCEDDDNHSCGSTPRGNKIYILDADTGNEVNTFTTSRSVVADVTIVPDSTGKAKYAYAADTGGNVYRITFGSGGSADWSMVKIASLGCSGASASCDANRKFMFAPDVIQSGSTYYVLLGSGDREKPLSSYAGATSVSNYFFMLKDQPASSTWLSAENATCGADLLCLGSLFPITGADTPSDAELADKKGWYLAFADNEQVVTSAITVYGVVSFSTHTPAVYSAGQCSTLGTAKVYNIDYENAESANGTGNRYEEIAGGGLPPSPVAGMVTLDDGTTVPFVIGKNPDSPLEGGTPEPGTDAIQPKAKVYWNIEQ